MRAAAASTPVCPVFIREVDAVVADRSGFAQVQTLGAVAGAGGGAGSHPGNGVANAIQIQAQVENRIESTQSASLPRVPPQAHAFQPCLVVPPWHCVRECAGPRIKGAATMRCDRDGPCRDSAVRVTSSPSRVVVYVPANSKE